MNKSNRPAQPVQEKTDSGGERLISEMHDADSVFLQEVNKILEQNSSSLTGDMLENSVGEDKIEMAGDRR